MRHSSWTLFLVPLALPLVLLCFPGSLKQVNQSPAETGAAVELAQESAVPSLTPAGATTGSLDETTSEHSESLYKD
jgi:hypothetical protein